MYLSGRLSKVMGLRIKHTAKNVPEFSKIDVDDTFALQYASETLSLITTFASC